MFKTILKILGGLFALVILVGAGVFINVWYFKPFDINLFFGRTALQFALESPELLSSVRVLEKFGIDGHNARLDDASIASGDRLFKQLEDAREVLLSYDDGDLSEPDRFSKEIMLVMMDKLPEFKRFRFHNYPLNQLFGEQNGFPSFMESTHQVHEVGDAEDYITRLSLIDTKFDQVLEGLRKREELGILPPQFVVDKVLEEMHNFVATPSDEGILYTALMDKMQKAELDESEQNRLAAAAQAEIDNTVYPAYGKLIAYFEELDAKVDGNHGVWNLPDGDDLYRLALQFFTTTDYSPDYIHGVGLADVDRIQAEILAILEEQGWDVSDDFHSAIEAMAEDPRFYYPDTDEGREQILADYRSIIAEISTGMDKFFDVAPSAVVEVERVPEFKEKTAPGAYYNRPAMDGSRPGVFYANLYDIKATPKYSMRTLAYHEAVPGHHFQLAVQQELEDLPFFRRLIPFTAYAEGWGLYAERLAWEMGFQNDPYDNIGRLQAELFRAVRLVVDTGIHAKRWSREQAIDYMIANTGIAESDVVSEVERYFVMPGQACAYKVGMTKIVELREMARSELGEQFDIREFHNVVLSNAAVPLTILERLVREYVAETRAKTPAAG